MEKYIFEIEKDLAALTKFALHPVARLHCAQ
jgi:hypothetical protein